MGTHMNLILLHGLLIISYRSKFVLLLFLSRATVDHSDADLAQHFKLNISDNGDGKARPINSADVEFARK